MSHLERSQPEVELLVAEGVHDGGNHNDEPQREFRDVVDHLRDCVVAEAWHLRIGGGQNLHMPSRDARR